MTRTHQYRVIEASWGVAIDLTASLKPTGDDFPVKINFSDQSIGTDLQSSAKSGLDCVLRAFPATKEMLVGKSLVIQKIEYTPTDFQLEGVSCAVAEWLCEELEFSPTPLYLEFDWSTHRYEITERANIKE